MLEVGKSRMVSVGGQLPEELSEPVVVTVVHRPLRRSRNRAELSRACREHTVDSRPCNCPGTHLRGRQKVNELWAELLPQAGYEQRSRRTRRPQLFERNRAFVRGRGVCDDRFLSQQRRHHRNGTLHAREAPPATMIVRTRLPIPVTSRAEVEHVHRYQVQTRRRRPQTRLLTPGPIRIPKIEMPLAAIDFHAFRLHEHPVCGRSVDPPPNPVSTTDGLGGLSKRHHGYRCRGTRHHNLTDGRFSPSQLGPLTRLHMLHGMDTCSPKCL